MENLVSAPDLEAALDRLSVADMQDICRENLISIQGNKSVLRNKLRKFVKEAKILKAHQATIQFPGLPADLTQQSMEIRSILANLSVPVSRSTENFSTLPDPNATLNISPILNQTSGNGTLQNTAVPVNTGAPILENFDPNVSRVSTTVTRAESSPLQAGDLADFGQPIPLVNPPVNQSIAADVPTSISLFGDMMARWQQFLQFSQNFNATNPVPAYRARNKILVIWGKAIIICHHR